jgi:hypothetical protein
MDSGSDTDSDNDEYHHLYNLLVGDKEIAPDPDDDDSGCDWTTIPDYPGELGSDSVDTYLLNVARQEIVTVKNNFMLRLFGANNEENGRVPAKDVEPATILKEFLNSEFLGLVRTQINKHISGDPFSSDEITAFVRVQLFISLYQCSAASFFNKKNLDAYPAAGLGMSHRRYSDALEALGKSSSPYFYKSCRWLPPMQHDRYLAQALTHVSRTCADIGFVPGKSILLSLDDDLLKSRASKAKRVWLQHEGDPSRGLGAVHHGIVSICTGLYLGGHIAARGETTQDCT